MEVGCSHSRFFLFLLILILFVCLYIYVEVRSFAFECESYLLSESMLTTRQAHPAAASSPREMRVVLWSTPSPAGIPQLRQHQHEIDVVGSPSLHVPFVSRLPRRRAARCWILAPRHRCCAALSTSTRTHDPTGGYDTDLVHGGTMQPTQPMPDFGIGYTLPHGAGPPTTGLLSGRRAEHPPRF